MFKLFIASIIISPLLFPQSDPINFFSAENIRLFADYLFCEGDLQRAVEQYQSVQPLFDDDTIDYKIMYSYSVTGHFQKSNELFYKIKLESDFYTSAHLLSMKNEMLMDIKSVFSTTKVSNDSAYTKNFNKLRIISMLYDDKLTYSRERFTYSFDEEEKEQVAGLYDSKFNPPHKEPFLAGLYSTIIPGSGKMYVGEWGDGIVALLATGLLAFLAYDNFDAGHETRAWIFTGLGAFFYAGNIYGSVASAQIYNAKINFEFNKALNIFLEQKNYFIPEYDFCK